VQGARQKNLEKELVDGYVRMAKEGDVEVAEVNLKVGTEI